jgi:3-oxoacyl-[acyl-carrier-protein] synthase-3
VNSIYINACESYLPETRFTVDQAVAENKYDQKDAEADGYTAASVEENLWPSDMAMQAADKVLKKSGVSATDLSLITYSAIHRHGHKHLWQPAAYIQDQLGAQQAMAFSLNHGCNALMLSAGMAMEHCQLSDTRHSLLVSSDRFEQSAFDRWQSDYGLIYGDAAVAVMLSQTPGRFRVEYFSQKSAAGLESMHRMESPVGENAEQMQSLHNVRESKKQYLTNNGKEQFESTLINTLTELREKLLTNTELGQHMADWVVLPNVGKRVLQSVYEPVFADLAIGDLWQAGKDIGHAGASDQFLGLSVLEQSGDLKPGHLVLLVGAGAGFSCSVMLLKVMDDFSYKTS